MATLQPVEQADTEIEVKKSRFIGFGFPITSAEQFAVFRAELKARYPDANHHCWAFKLHKAGICGQSDDFEPKGTAGMPMLKVLEYSSYANIGVVAVRYFGGTKLGTGGLARAYADTVKAVLEVMKFEDIVEREIIKVYVDYEFEASIRHLTNQFSAVHLSTEYTNDVMLRLEIKPQDIEQFENELNNMTKGKGKLFRP